MSELRRDYAKLLRAMLEAYRAAETASAELTAKQKAYIDAQSAFTGKFAECDYPLGPFVVGGTLITHNPTNDTRPQKCDQFDYRKVIRCPTSD